MKVTYDTEVDVLRIVLNSRAVAESDEHKPGVILDYDREGGLVGLEILLASQRVEDPRVMEYAIQGEAEARIRSFDPPEPSGLHRPRGYL